MKHFISHRISILVLALFVGSGFRNGSAQLLVQDTLRIRIPEIEPASPVGTQIDSVIDLRTDPWNLAITESNQLLLIPVDLVTSRIFFISFCVQSHIPIIYNPLRAMSTIFSPLEQRVRLGGSS